MCSMIACILIPGFELRAALRMRPRLQIGPVALAPLPGQEQLLGPVTAAADAAGVRPGMRIGEALATCPALVLVEQDPAGAEQAWEEIIRRLEDDGFAVEPAEPGCLYLETRVVERLYGGLEPALKRVLAAVGSAWDPRAGAAQRRFAALAAASIARPGQALVVSAERLEFPEAVGNELTLRRALDVLVDRVLARPERRGRELRKIALSARVVGGGSWRRTLTLRDPNADRDRLSTALAPRLMELPAPALALGIELVELTDSAGRQLELVKPEGAELRTRLKDGLGQARASAGTGAVCTVVEVAPWSRIPEQRALLVP